MFTSPALSVSHQGSFMSALPQYTLADLLQLMHRLRDPETGCPWDVKQTYKSIAPSTIEEAYEVVDAIESGDLLHLKEELGDLLFQVVFYAQLAVEDKIYSFDEIVSDLVAKLIRRHPHVFPDGTLESSVKVCQLSDLEIKQSWEAIKKAERKTKGSGGLLDDVPSSLPAVTRAIKLQKRASSVGFDWSNSSQVFGKVKEEIIELEAALKSAQKEEVEDELGDVMFTLLSLARHERLDPESVLRKANAKFMARFERVEQKANSSGSPLGKAGKSDMEKWWRQAKLEGL